MDKYFVANAELSKFSRDYMDLRKNLPIRPSEMGVLNIITGIPGLHTSIELAERLGVSKPMIATHLSVLLRKGYIIKQQSEEDKRIFYILPTEKAKELVAFEREKQDELLGLFEREMGEDEFDNLVKLLRIANQILDMDRRKKE